MTDEWLVVDVLAGEFSPNVEGWAVILRKPNGKQYAHIFPKSIFEWRAAEYGLDDPEEILDIVLHENYVDQKQETKMVSVLEGSPVQAQNRAAKSSLPTLFEAKSTDEAVKAHRERIARVKADKVKVSDPNGLLSHIKDNHGMDPSAIREKREAVDTHRWVKLYGGLPIENMKEA